MLTLQQSELIQSKFGRGVTFYYPHPISGIQEAALVTGYTLDPQRGFLSGVKVEFPDGERVVIEAKEMLEIKLPADTPAAS